MQGPQQRSPGTGAEAEASPAPKGGSRLGWQGGKRERGAAGDLPLAKAFGHSRPAPTSPAKSLLPRPQLNDTNPGS